MNEKVIWDCLLAKIGNEFGVAAIMGNLMAESSLNPRNATNLKKTGYPNADQYIIASDDGVHDFAHDGVAFGLVQWCYWSRKQGLIDYAKATGRSVGHLQMQLEYMWQEVQKYPSVYSAVTLAKDIRSASDVFMLKYEKPAGTSEAAKQKRAAYGQKYYDQFAKERPAPTGKKMVRTTDTVNIRAGSSLNTEKLGKLNKGVSMEWLATENGFHKVAIWVSGNFSEVKG